MRISSTDPPTPYRARVRDEEPVFLGEFYRPSNDDEASEREVRRVQHTAQIDSSVPLQGLQPQRMLAAVHERPSRL